MGIAENICAAGVDHKRNGSQAKCLWLLRTEMEPKEDAK